MKNEAYMKRIADRSHRTVGCDVNSDIGKINLRAARHLERVISKCKTQTEIRHEMKRLQDSAECMKKRHDKEYYSRIVAVLREAKDAVLAFQQGDMKAVYGIHSNFMKQAAKHT
ncbi:MAG: hypothetical protein J6Q22_05250 [Prevotella sp.]|nr:hypothetical protein [Prevotella sp.]